MKNNRILLLIIIVSIIGLGFVFYLNSKTDKKPVSNIEFQSSNWEDQFLLNNKDPRGLYVFRALTIADGGFTQFNEYSNYKLLDSIVALDSSLLMYIGENFTLTDNEIDLVLKSIYQGNHFFLSSEEVPNYLYNRIFEQPTLQFIPKTKAIFKIHKQQYEMYDIYENDTLTGLWNVFQNKQLTVDEVNVMSTLHRRAVFISIPYGKGKIFLHLNPEVFMNYQLLRKEGGDYLKEVLSCFQQPHIQWLTFAKYKPIAYDDSFGKNPPNMSLLKELSKNPAFRWGFTFAVFGWLLYLIFRSKRKQPVIPVIEKHKNTGFSYVDTLAGIFYDRNHSGKILKIMQQNFNQAVLEHFYVDLNKKDKKEAVLSLSKKSNVSTEEIASLVKRLKVTTKVNDAFLIETYNAQRSFYFKSGIWGKEEKQLQESEGIKIYRKKGWGIGTILLGVYFLLQGFYLLTVSFGAGVLFWPLGLAICVLGTRMLNTPALELRPDSICLHHLMMKKTTILKENIKFIERNNTVLIVHLKNANKITINIVLLGLNEERLRAIQKRYKN